MQFPASSSSSSNLNPINSGPLHIINQSASLLFLFSTQLLYQREQPLAYIPIQPFPQKGRENLQPPPSTSHQATSYLQHLHHVANPLCNSTSLTISLASLRHFYLVQTPQNKDHRGRGVSAVVVAGRFQRRNADIGLFPETRTVNAHDLSQGPGVVPDRLKGDEDRKIHQQDPAMVLKIDFVLVRFLFGHFKAAANLPHCIICHCSLLK